MKILTIGPAASPHLIRPVRSLLNRGHVVCMLGYQTDAPPAECRKYKNFLWLADPGGEPYPSSEISMRRTLSLLSSIVTTFRPDLVHVHWLSWHLGLCAKHFPAIPRVVSIWGSDLNLALARGPNGDYFWNNNKVAHAAQYLAHAQRIIVDDVTMNAKCAFAAPNVPVDVLTLGVDEPFFRPTQNHQQIKSRLGLPFEHIFTSARLISPVYRPQDIMRAFRTAAQGRDAALVFKTYLADPASKAELEKLARDLDIQNQIRFCEILSSRELRDLYSVSTALINFPERDAFPVTFAEAAAAGSRVISCWHLAYDVALVRECFHVLKEANVEALAKAFAEHMCQEDSPQRRKRAFDIAKEQYQHANYVNGLLDIYTELTGKK